MLNMLILRGYQDTNPNEVKKKNQNNALFMKNCSTIAVVVEIEPQKIQTVWN